MMKYLCQYVTPLYSKSFDTDGNGKLSKDEMIAACKKLKLTLTEEEISQLIENFDITGDGLACIIYLTFAY